MSLAQKYKQSLQSGKSCASTIRKCAENTEKQFFICASANMKNKEFTFAMSVLLRSNQQTNTETTKLSAANIETQ